MRTMKVRLKNGRLLCSKYVVVDNLDVNAVHAQIDGSCTAKGPTSKDAIPPEPQRPPFLK